MESSLCSRSSTCSCREKKLRTYLFRLSPLAGDEDQLFINKLGEVGRAILIGNGIGSSLQGLVAGLAWARGGTAFAGVMGLGDGGGGLSSLGGRGRGGGARDFLPVVRGPARGRRGLLHFLHGQSFLFEYGLKPRLMGSSMRMNSLVVFLSLLGGILGFGAAWDPLRAAHHDAVSGPGAAL